MGTYSPREGSPDVDRLVAHLGDMARFALTARAERSVTSLAVAIDREAAAPLRKLLSPRRQIEDPYTGLIYTARAVGETIIACGGLGLLTTVLDRIEAEIGAREAEWLSRRWVGLADGIGGPGHTD